MKTLPYFGLCFAIDFRTYNEGWSASGYKFLLTTNRGETWDEFETPDSSTVYDVQFTDALTGYAVGENGVILKLDPTLVGVEKELPPPADFILYQNYPNPFNPSTKIIYQISDFGFVSLTIYDVLGNKINTLLNEYKLAGEYEVDFYPFNLAPGIYFYQLRAGDFIQTKKMIYLK